MNWKHNTPPYRIETERLSLRVWDPARAADLVALIADSQLTLLPWMPWAKAVPTLADEVNLLREFRGNYDLGKDFVLGIFDPAGRLLGSTGMHTRQGPDALEIGYWLGSGFEGRGYATEAASALIRVAFELSDVKRVDVLAASDNDKSRAVIERLGLSFCGSLKGRFIDAFDKPHDLDHWSVSREAYQTSAHKKIAVSCFRADGEMIQIE